MKFMRWLPPALAVLAINYLSFITLVFASTARRLTDMQTVTQSRRSERVSKHEDPLRTRRDNPPVQEARTPAPPPPRDEPAFSFDASVPVLPSVLAALRPEVHDPDALLARVLRLREAGLDIFLVRTNLGRDLFDGITDRRARITPVVQNGKTVGLRLSSHRGPSSIEALAGMLPGDVLLSINGFDVNSPDQALRAYAISEKHGAAILELLRNGRRVVLDVRFPK